MTSRPRATGPTLFSAYDDFVVFAQRLGLVERRYKQIQDQFIDGHEAVFSLIDCSMLPEECKQLYKDHVKDRGRALSYSFSGLRE